MDLKQIEYFLHLAEYEHVSKTADFLGISQPALSKSISALEQDVGTPLFDRIGNRIKLNENGRRFKEYAQKAINLINLGLVSAREFRYEVTGNISIYCRTYAPILMPCINEYAGLNPLINFSVMQYADHNSQISAPDSSCDFILTSSLSEEPSLDKDQFWISKRLFSEDGFLVITPAHPLFDLFCSMGDVIDPEALKDVQFIGMRRNEQIINSIDSSQHKNRGFIPKTYFQTDDFNVRMHALRSGLGVALIPEVCLEDARRLCPGLRHFKIKNRPSPHRHIILMRKKDNLLSEAALDFWNFVLDYYNIQS